MKPWLVLVGMAILAPLPWAVQSQYVFHIATMISIVAPMALSLNLMLKIGQLSIAQPAFMGIGAYASALLTMRLGMPPVLSILLAATLAALSALATGPIFLRVKGVYFVLLTYAFGQIVNLVFQEWTSLFGGNSGLYGIPKFSIFGARLTVVDHYYILGLIFTALSYALMHAMERSDIGAILQSLNENEMLSRSIGSDAIAWRIGAFTVGAFITGISGGIYAFYIGFLSPDAFGFRSSIDLIVINAIGGVNSALGALLGTIIVVPLPELLRDAREYQLLIYGLCLIFFLIFFKQGLVALFDRKRRVA
ncbi:amino acid/amide ABC transporter membrane protein 2, HAAT family [Burkholderia sp. YR290]|nr:amino acid/amide ABC transporter membrane protein 2, HAAT family [Burkholderia sp. YR290]